MSVQSCGLESSDLVLGIPGIEFFICRFVQGNSLPDVIGAKQGGFLWDKMPQAPPRDPIFRIMLNNSATCVYKKCGSMLAELLCITRVRAALNLVEYRCALLSGRKFLLSHAHGADLRPIRGVIWHRTRTLTMELREGGPHVCHTRFLALNSKYPWRLRRYRERLGECDSAQSVSNI